MQKKECSYNRLQSEFHDLFIAERISINVGRFCRYKSSVLSLGNISINRAVGAGGHSLPSSQFWADQLTLSLRGGGLCPPYYYPPPLRSFRPSFGLGIRTTVPAMRTRGALFMYNMYIEKGCRVS